MKANRYRLGFNHITKATCKPTNIKKQIYLGFMLTSANGETAGQENQPDWALQDGEAHLPQQLPAGRSPALGHGWNIQRCMIWGHPSACSCPSVGWPQGRNVNKALTAPWCYFCEEWLCLECVKVRLAPALYPAIRACDTRPVTYYNSVLRLHKYFTEWLKHNWYIFSVS